MKHRKLFATLVGTNQTYCVDFCDPYCPDDCYPDFYLTPPPPPPPPPPLSAGQSHHLSPYIIIIATSLASFFLLVTTYFLITRYCSDRNLFRHPPENEAAGQDENFLDENQGPEIDHPIWYINTVGLQPSIINSITVFRYKKGTSLIEGTDCSVCLSEFQEDETLRLLPKCNHAFHIPCIDTWLRSHTNCPLCRARIMSNSATDSPHFGSSNDQNSHNLSGLEEETQMGNLDDNGGFGGNHIRNGEICENRAVETGDGVEVSVADAERDDLDHAKDSLITNLDTVEDIKSVRRSMSVDFAPSAENQDGADSRVNGLVGNPSFLHSLHKSPVSMKRSFSCNARLLLSRCNCNPNSILPL